VSLPNATAKVTPEMKDQLLSSELVVLAGDCDNAVGSETMKKLWAELDDRATLLQWPNWKDANDTFLKDSKGDIKAFRELVEKLVSAARSVVMPGIYSLQESMMSHHQSDLANHPKRFRFPWKNVDEMAIILPGDVVAILATNTKMGKTCWIMNATVYAAQMHDEVVLNYQCELSLDRFNTMVAAYKLRRDRNHLSVEDINEAAKRLGNAKYYIGSNPALNTVGPVLDLIEAGIRRLGATVVVLDHIHFVCRNASDEIKAQSDASQRISNMAKKYQVKFFMVEQPRKATQQNRGKRLQVSDGKGSEALHSDAAAIFAIHRDLVKILEPPPPDPYSPLTQVYLLGGARSKGDGSSEARLMFLGKFACFNELAYERDDLQNPADRDTFELKG
jgi:replicative DNA helicase